MTGLKTLPLWQCQHAFFKREKNTMETSTKISSVYNEGVIINWQVFNWFAKFHSKDMSFKMNLEKGTHLTLIIKL